MNTGRLFEKLKHCRYIVGVSRVEEWLLEAKKEFPDFSKETTDVQGVWADMAAYFQKFLQDLRILLNCKDYFSFL